MGQVINTGAFNKKFIAIGNREMLIRRIYWPMEEFLKGEHELTIGMLCTPVNNEDTSSTWAAQTLEASDANSFYFGLRSVANTSSFGYEFLPYSSGSAFIGMKTKGSAILADGWSTSYSRARSIAGTINFTGKSMASSIFEVNENANDTINNDGYNYGASPPPFGASTANNHSSNAPIYSTQIVVSFKYDKNNKLLFTRWKYFGGDMDQTNEVSLCTESISTKTHLMSVMNYDSAYFNLWGSATSSIDLTNDDIMNFFVFWPFTTARLAVHAYGWQLT